MTCERLRHDEYLVDPSEHDTHLDGCPHCRERYNEYLRIVQAIAGGQSSHPLPPGWKERALARVHEGKSAHRRQKHIAIGTAVAATMAAATVLLVLRRAPEVVATLTLVVTDGEKQWRSSVKPFKPVRRGLDGTNPPPHEQSARATLGIAPLGSEVMANALAPGSAWSELRIYREARELLLRCPGAPEPACRRVDGGVEVRWHAPSVGDYQIVWLAGQSSPPPATGVLEADIESATKAGARVVATESLHVF